MKSQSTTGSQDHHLDTNLRVRVDQARMSIRQAARRRLDRRLTASSPLGGASFVYDWRSKNEQVLWLADAIAGAVGEYVTGQNTEWFARLDGADAIELISRPI
jgi:hypothetical protein